MVLDDDVDLRRSIDRFLRADGFVVDLAASPADADEKVAVNRSDALLTHAVRAAGHLAEHRAGRMGRGHRTGPSR